MEEERDSTHPDRVDPFAHVALSSRTQMPVLVLAEQTFIALRRLRVIGEKSRDQTEKLAVRADPIRLERAVSGACGRLIG